MAVSAFAKPFSAKMDPHDRVDWGFDTTKKLDIDGGERVDLSTVLVSLDAAAVLLGMRLGEGSREVVLASNDNDVPDTVIQFWTEFESGAWADPAFDGKGTQCAVNVLFSTTTQKARRYERTGLITVAQL